MFLRNFAVRFRELRQLGGRTRSKLGIPFTCTTIVRFEIVVLKSSLDCLNQPSFAITLRLSVLT